MRVVLPSVPRGRHKHKGGDANHRERLWGFPAHYFGRRALFPIIRARQQSVRLFHSVITYRCGVVSPDGTLVGVVLYSLRGRVVVLLSSYLANARVTYEGGTLAFFLSPVVCRFFIVLSLKVSMCQK